jgi:hypothetical protein
MMGDFLGLIGLSIEDITNVRWKVEVLLKRSVTASLRYASGHPLLPLHLHRHHLLPHHDEHGVVHPWTIEIVEVTFINLSIVLH